MRLLHAKSKKFRDFDESRLPSYAILSHTWETEEEVTLQDMSLPYLPTKKGYTKVTETCSLALHHGIEYVWVDTCCIDKTSSAELTESINSMFRWYRKATICFVYLSDLSAETRIEQGMSMCRWFTRGWTLQELLAPNELQFYDQAWNYRGLKSDFATDISMVTGIPHAAIVGQFCQESYSTAQKMAWASRRQTTRIEDIAYCLLGLFDVNMPLIYGEGSKAFRRLQEEIIKQCIDPTLFSWQPSQPPQGPYSSLLASSPADFGQCHNIMPYGFGEFWSTFVYAITNQGLQISASLTLVPVASDGPDVNEVARYVLTLGKLGIGTTAYRIGIYLKKIGPALLVRETAPTLAYITGRDLESYRRTKPYTFCILTAVSNQSPNADIPMLTFPAFYMPNHHNIHLDCTSAVPVGYWDHRRRICFRPPSRHTVVAYSFKALTRYTSLSFGVLFDFCSYYEHTPSPRCVVFDPREFSSRLLFIILQGKTADPVEWREIENRLPEVTELTNYLRMQVDAREFRITAVTHKKMVELGSDLMKCPVLEIEVEEI